jgi:hypothetical protein
MCALHFQTYSKLVISAVLINRRLNITKKGTRVDWFVSVVRRIREFHIMSLIYTVHIPVLLVRAMNAFSVTFFGPPPLEKEKLSSHYSHCIFCLVPGNTYLLTFHTCSCWLFWFPAHFLKRYHG